MKAVVLAAGQGTRLAPFTNDRPKPLVSVGGRPLLWRTLDRLAEVGLTGADVVVVGGYRIEALRQAVPRDVQLVVNGDYAGYNNWRSLLCARAATTGETVVQIDGDVLFGAALLPRLLASPGPAVLAVDERATLDAETMKVAAEGGRVTAVSKRLEPRTAIGEFVGIARLDAEIVETVMAELAGFPAAGWGHEYYEHAYHVLAGRGAGPFRSCAVGDLATIEIDDAADLERAEALLAGRGIV